MEACKFAVANGCQISMWEADVVAIGCQISMGEAVVVAVVMLCSIS